MDDGRRIEEGTKYKAAVAKNVPIIDEDKLLDMIRSSCPQPANASGSIQGRCAGQERACDFKKSIIPATEPANQAS